MTFVTRISDLRRQLEDLQERAGNPDLTPQEQEEIDVEWEIVNGEIEAMEELLWLQIPNAWAAHELEEPEEQEYYQERELEDYIPSLHEQQNDYTYEPVFDLADEV